MPSPKQSSDSANKRVVPEWKNDPWNERSEEFYTMCYKNGSCRYCHKQINTKLDFCDCYGMKAARARFKIIIGNKPKPAPEPIDYDPDKYIRGPEQSFEEEL